MMRISQRIQLKKTITWSIISFVVTAAAGWILTGDLVFGLGIGALDRVIKTGLYYIHERMWHKKYKDEKTARRIKNG